MKGKYVNTGIMLAALSGKKRYKNNGNETLLSLNGHRIIWRKQENKTKVTTDCNQTILIN